MPVYDLRCPSCGVVWPDKYQPMTTVQALCDCGQSRLERIPPTQNPGKASGVIGDECDVSVRHGICWPNGEPRRYTSKAEMAREAKRLGMESHVTHMPGSRGGDSSKHTSRWV